MGNGTERKFAEVGSDRVILEINSTLDFFQLEAEIFAIFAERASIFAAFSFNENSRKIKKRSRGPFAIRLARYQSVVVERCIDPNSGFYAFPVGTGCFDICARPGRRDKGDNDECSLNYPSNGANLKSTRKIRGFALYFSLPFRSFP